MISQVISPKEYGHYHKSFFNFLEVEAKTFATSFCKTSICITKKS